jgi:hypothetical protein
VIAGVTTLSATPNPFHNQVNISFANASGKAALQVFDAKGVKVYEQKNISGTQVSWTPTGLKQGMYIAKVKTGERTYTHRIICIK